MTLAHEQSCILSFLNQDHAEYPAKRTPKQSEDHL
jgi:hypothetical protein